MRFGLELDASLGDQADFNLLASHRMKWLNSFGAEWRNDLILGSDVLLSTELYQPLSTRQYLFVAPSLRYSIDEFDLYADNLRIAEYRDQTITAGIDLGANFIQYGEARAGARVGSRNFQLRSGGVVAVAGTEVVAPCRSTTRSNFGAFTFSATLDRLDSINFPRHGYYARANVYASTDLLGADETYTRWDALVSAPFTWGSHTVEGLSRCRRQDRRRPDTRLRSIPAGRLSEFVRPLTRTVAQRSFLLRAPDLSQQGRQPSLVRGHTRRWFAGSSEPATVGAALAR